MKIIIRTSFIVLLCFSQLINSQSFVKVSGQATDIVISPKDGSVYVVNASGNVKKYNARTKKYIPYGKQSKNVKSISIHSNGSLYMVSTSNEVYIDINGRWNKIPGIKTNEVDIDKKGNVRALNLSGKLYNLYQGKWQLKNLVNKNTSGFNQLIGQDSKILYARFKNNNFKQFHGKWITLNGSPLKITIDDKTGNVYAVGRNKGIYKWNGRSKNWDLLKGTRKDFKDVAVHNGEIWAIATDKSIYYYDKNRTESQKDYSGTYRVTVKQLYASREYNRHLMTSLDVYGTIGIYVSSKTKSGKNQIIDINNKKSRVWDFSKSHPKKVKDISKKSINWVRQGNYAMKSGTDEVDGVIEVDKVREFKIAGEAANESLTFDIQTNLSYKLITHDVKYEWQRIKFKIDELKLGKEYFMKLSHEFGLDGGQLPLYVSFIIEKL